MGDAHCSGTGSEPAREYSDIRLELTQMGTAAQLAAVRSVEIDIAISYGHTGGQVSNALVLIEFGANVKPERTE